MRCLRKDPAERFQSAAELAEALEAARAGATTVDDADVVSAGFRRCAVCEVDNSGFATECLQCGSRLDTPEQKLFMRQHLAAIARATTRPAMELEAPAPTVVERGTPLPSTRLKTTARVTAIRDPPAPAIGSKRELLLLVASASVFIGLAYFALRAPELPDLSLTAEGPTPVTFSQARAGKPKLVVALILPGDPVSEKSVQRLKEHHAASQMKAAFAGVVFGDIAAAQAFRQSHDLPYPVYSLDRRQNPVEFNGLVKTVGGFRSRVYGGTVFVVDSKQKVIATVERDELLNLDELLEKL